jgi:hypothetical protein
MKIHGCKNCGTRFNGLRCPECGRPLPITGVLFVFVPTIVVLILLVAIIPDESVPRAKDLGNATTEYCFQSLGEAVFGPTCVMLCIIFFVLSLVVLKTRKVPRQSSPSVTGWLRYASWLAIGIRVAVASTLLALVVAFLITTFTASFTKARRIVVGPKTAEFHSLLWSWSLPRSRIKRVEFLREQRAVKQGVEVDMSLLVEDDVGGLHRTVQVRLEPRDPKSPHYTAVFEKAQAELRKKE